MEVDGNWAKGDEEVVVEALKKKFQAQFTGFD